MKLANPTGIYIPISEVFPDLQSNFETFRSLLQSLSRTDSLFWCARLNLVISSPSDSHRIIGQQVGLDFMERQQYGLDQFLTSEEINAINGFILRKGEGQRVAIFFRGQILELIRWITLYCHDHPGDGETFERPEIRRRFVQVALLASDIWAKRVYGNRFSLKCGVEIARQKSLGAIRKSMEAASSATDLSKSLGRGGILFENYFPNYYCGFKEEFQSLTSLSVEEYYNCLSALMINYMVPKIKANWTGIFDVNRVSEFFPYNNVLRKYIALESQTIDELRKSLWGGIEKNVNNDMDVQTYDYRPLREKPILRTEDGRAIILDPFFYSEKATIGPLFHLTRDKSRDKKANYIFNAFGKAFEKYACDILMRMFPDIPSSLNKRLACNIHGVDAAGNELEIDACLNNVREIVLFEIKAVWTCENEILGDEYEKYLRKKYVSTEGTNRDRKNQAIGQLARIISILSSKKWLGPNREFSEAQLIYPVLLVHDQFLAAPVYGKYFASEFKKLVIPDDELRSGELRKGNIRIAPLIVLTIEDLENLETSIEYFGFINFIADYSKACPDRMIPVGNFISYSKYGQKIYRNKTTTAKGAELLGRSIKAVFGMDGNQHA